MVVLAILGLLTYMGQFWGNVRTVEPGQVYRSAQLTGARLGHVLRENRIRSVINLRGPLPRDKALRAERAQCAALGIVHADVKLSASRPPSPDQLRLLLSDFDRLPRPILIHCAGGADRSGLASAIYLNVYKSTPLNTAERDQLTWRYGHLSFSAAHPMDDFFTLYRRTSGGRPLRQWIERDYPRLFAQHTAHR